MTEKTESAQGGVVALRPFVPASDFQASLRFYSDLGFTAHMLGDDLASIEIQSGTESFKFLLQHFSAPGYAENYMMHMLVKDLDAWWKHIEALDLAANYGVRAPSAPKLQPWGLVVSYVVDPSGVLWHIAQVRANSSAS